MLRIILGSVVLLVLSGYPLYNVVFSDECVQKLCDCSGPKISCRLSARRQFGTQLPNWTDASSSSTSVSILDQAQLRTLQDNGFVFFNSLHNLIINNSRTLTEIEPHWMNGIDTTLKEFRIIKAPDLTKLFSKFFTNDTQLQTIEISGTSLTQVNFLHGTTGNGVRTLILKENEINSFIPGSFLGFKNLEEVDLRSNKLVSLDKCSLEHVILKLDKFYLAGNAWLCSCPIKWIRTVNELRGTKSFEIHPAGDRSRKPNCDAPDTSRGQLLLNVSIVGCNIADSSWNARNCTKYKADAADYLTTVKPFIRGEKEEVNLLIVYVIVVSALAVILVTMIICCVTYYSLKKEMIEAAVEKPDEEKFWDLDEERRRRAAWRNPFKRFLLPFVRRNLANANPDTFSSKRDKKRKEKRRKSKLKNMKRKEISSVTAQLHKLKKSRVNAKG